MSTASPAANLGPRSLVEAAKIASMPQFKTQSSELRYQHTTETRGGTSKSRFVRKEHIVKSLGSHHLTEKEILRDVVDDRYTREVVRKLLAEAKIYRVGKGGPCDPFRYVAAEFYDGADKLPEGFVRDIGPNRRLLHTATVIKDLVCRARDGLTERIIRSVVGDNIGTGKALRSLISQGHVKRTGRGGSGDPYVYEVVSGFESVPVDMRVRTRDVAARLKENVAFLPSTALSLNAVDPEVPSSFGLRDVSPSRGTVVSAPSLPLALTSSNRAPPSLLKLNSNTKPSFEAFDSNPVVRGIPRFTGHELCQGERGEPVSWNISAPTPKSDQEPLPALDPVPSPIHEGLSVGLTTMKELLEFVQKDAKISVITHESSGYCPSACDDGSLVCKRCHEIVMPHEIQSHDSTCESDQNSALVDARVSPLTRSEKGVASSGANVRSGKHGYKAAVGSLRAQAHSSQSTGKFFSFSDIQSPPSTIGESCDSHAEEASIDCCAENDFPDHIAESRKPRKAYTRSKPYNVMSNPYMRFLQQNRQQLKDQILAVNPECKGKELTCAIATLAGRRWRQLTEEQRAQFKIAHSVPFADPTEHDDWMDDSWTAPKTPAAEVILQDVIVDDGQNQFSIWIDPNANQSPAFKSATVDEPIGQVMEGRFMPMVNVRHRRHDDGPHPLKLRRVKNKTNTPVLRSKTAAKSSPCLLTRSATHTDRARCSDPADSSSSYCQECGLGGGVLLECCKPNCSMRLHPMCCGCDPEVHQRGFECPRCKNPRLKMKSHLRYIACIVAAFLGDTESFGVWLGDNFVRYQRDDCVVAFPSQHNRSGEEVVNYSDPTQSVSLLCNLHKLQLTFATQKPPLVDPADLNFYTLATLKQHVKQFEVLRAFLNGSIDHEDMLEKMASCSSEPIHKWLREKCRSDDPRNGTFFKNLKKQFSKVIEKGSPTVGFSKYRMTLRQQRLHEGILNDPVKAKESPTKRPKYTQRRADSEDCCPDKVGASLKGGGKKRRDTSSLESPSTAKKRKPSLITHAHNDRVRRVSALIVKNEATPGLFVEVFPKEEDVAHPDDRWFMQVTSSTITGTGDNSALRGKWCKTNCLILEGGAKECSMRLSHVKDYGDKSIFVM